MLKKTAIKLAGTVSLLVLGSLSGSAFAGEPAFVAGTNPSERPSAPVIMSVSKPAGWYTKALTGVVPPYPVSLHFLETQGNWYTPFIHPGMPGPYDIRNWHN